jgi:hypothetical protein
VNERPRADIWQDERFDAARRKLYRGERDFGPCLGCDATSYRVGLLPDRMGKQRMAEPTADTRRILKDACSGPSYTAPVRRPWELSEEGSPLTRLVQIQRRELAG